MLPREQMKELSELIRNNLASLGATFKAGSHHLLVKFDDHAATSSEIYLSVWRMILARAYHEARRVRPSHAIDLRQMTVSALVRSIINEARSLDADYVIASPHICHALVAEGSITRSAEYDQHIIGKMGPYEVVIDLEAKDDDPVLIVKKGWVSFRKSDSISNNDVRQFDDETYLEIQNTFSPSIYPSRIVTIDVTNNKMLTTPRHRDVDYGDLHL